VESYYHSVGEYLQVGLRRIQRILKFAKKKPEAPLPNLKKLEASMPWRLAEVLKRGGATITTKTINKNKINKTIYMCFLCFKTFLTKNDRILAHTVLKLYAGQTLTTHVQ
jgi:hypothetical protein